MKRYLAFAYSLVAYILFLGSLLYLIAFLGNFIVPKTIDSGTPVSLPIALAANISLILLFAMQHTIMARRGFKAWLTRIIPEAIERSTFLLFSAVAVIAICAFWQPMPSTLYKVEQPALAWALQGISLFGWAMLVISTFLIDHFEFAGLQQAFAHLRGTTIAEASFKTPGLYRIVRHPMMLGILLGIWATPQMSVGHLVFSLAFTAYIAVGVQFEERDLLRTFPVEYKKYQQTTPMFLPIPGWKGKAASQEAKASK